MRKQGIAAVLAAFGLFLFLGGTAQAGSITIDNTYSGYINSGDNFTGIRPNTNFLVGNCSPSDCQACPPPNPSCTTTYGEYRNFFYFTVPMLEKPITSATLAIPTRSTILDQSPTLDYQVTSLGLTPSELGGGSFSSLGTGTVYGGHVYSAADGFTTVDISLDAAAIAALGEGGLLFGLSGRAISPIDFSVNGADQLVFGRTQGQITELIITTAPGPIPGMGLFGLAFLSLAGVATRARRSLGE
jgi:hypothetical protein